MVTVFDSEDGKCFIMEFCVYPEFRGGTGYGVRKRVARLVENRRRKILGAELLGRTAHSLLEANRICAKRLGRMGRAADADARGEIAGFHRKFSGGLAASSDGKQLSECNRRGRNGRRAVGSPAFRHS